MCSQSGEEPSESQPFPQAMGNEEVGDCAGRERGKGVDNMFPLVLNTEKNSMGNSEEQHCDVKLAL